MLSTYAPPVSLALKMMSMPVSAAAFTPREPARTGAPNLAPLSVDR
jgi:hypothetical protein